MLPSQTVTACAVGGYSHSGDVFTGEGIGGVTNQQTGLTHSPEEKRRENTKYRNTNMEFSYIDIILCTNQNGLYVCVDTQLYV